VVDRSPLAIAALAADDRRVFNAFVAGPAALLVSKLHKLSERVGDPDRLADKDAYDVYRLLMKVSTPELVAAFSWLRDDPLAGEPTQAALATLDRLFASSPRALGSFMAGRAEAGLGTPEVVAASVAALATDLLKSLSTG
jgi:hypothetical protein